MKIKIIFGALFLTLSFNTFAQDAQPTPQSTPQKTADQTTSGYTRPDAKTRRNKYFNSMFGPYAIAQTVASAGFGTWRNSPEEWGGKWEGFGRRVASGFGKSAIKQTTIYALDESFKLDSNFYRSQKRSFGAKVKNAVISPFTARKPNDKRVVGFPRIVGTYTSSIIAAETWYPKRYNYRDGLRSGTISLGLNVAFNLFKEFIKK